MSTNRFARLFTGFFALTLLFISVVGVIHAAPPATIPPYPRPLTAVLPPPTVFTVTKTASTSSAVPGEVVTYTVRIATGSQTQLTDVAVTDPLPANTSFVPGSVQISPPSAGGTVGTPPQIATDMTVVTHSVVTVVYAVTIDQPLAGGTLITNNASVTSTEVPTPTIRSAVVTVQNVAPTAADGTNTTQEDTSVNGTLSATDPNNDALTFSIVDQPANGTVSITDPLQGKYAYSPTLNFFGDDTFTFKANDGNLNSNTAAVTVTVSPVNDPPKLDPTGPQSVDEAAELSFTVYASDPDSPPPLTISFLNMPSGASVSNGSTNSLTFTWTPTEAQGPGSYNTTVVASDGLLTDSEIIPITVNEVNQSPVLNSIGAKSVDEEATLSFTASASDPDLPANPLAYSLLAPPAGTTINPSTGEFSWTPTEAQGPGVYSTTVVVSDGVLTNSEIIPITVNEVNRPPVLNSIGAKSVDEEATLSFTASASDPDLPASPLAYSLLTPPAGATINPSTGEFSWTPTEAQGPGVYNTTVVVSDGVLTDSETIPITVNEIADVWINKTAPASAVAGSPTPVTYVLIVGNDGPSIAKSVVVTDTLPAGTTFKSASPSAGTCNYSAGRVVCNVGNIARNSFKTAAIDVWVDSSTTSDLTNVAAAASTLIDRDLANNTASAITTVTTAANLTLDKTDAVDPVLVGDPLTYTLTVNNLGPSDATNVTLTDTLPGSVDFSDASTGCVNNSGTVTCVLGTLVAGEAREVTIVVLPAAPGTINNSATVTSDVSDEVPGNNNASETTTVNPKADLALTKEATPNPVAAGDTLTYTLTVLNQGPSPAENVTLTDVLPSEINFVSATPDQGSCSGTTTVVCSLGTLPAGDSTVVTIVVTPLTLGTLDNTATISTSTTDPVQGNNTAAVQVSVTTRADLSIIKTDSPDPVVAGETITYTLTVTNNGPSVATNVTIADDLPPGVNFDSATAGCVEIGDTVTCSVGTLSAGVSASVQIVVFVDPAVTNTLENNASVSGNEFDPTSDNNTTTVSTTVITRADLSLTKIDSPDPATAGDSITYTLTVVNRGPSNATGVMVVDTLPVELSVASAPGCVLGGRVITCTVGTLAAGQTIPLEIVAGVSLDTMGDITNTATVFGNETDLDATNNTATETTRITPAIDLQLSKSGQPNPVIAGEALTYTLTVTNGSLHNATGVSVTDNLPANATFVSASPGCTELGGDVTCTVGTLVGGGVESLVIRVVINAATTKTLLNTATVTGNEFDPDPGNNTATMETTVNTRANLVLSKTNAPNPVVAGEPLTYTLSVTNAGPSDAVGVVITDTLPPGVSFQSASPGCVEAGGTVVCTVGTVANGNTESVTIVVLVNAATVGNLENTAVVAGSTTDLQPGNNTAVASAGVDTEVDLSLSGSDSVDPVFVGDDLTLVWTVENYGPSDATTVVLTASVSLSLTINTVTPSQGYCSGLHPIVCTLDTLTSSSVATVTIQGTVAASATGTMRTAAVVTANEADPDTNNNAGLEETAVVLPAPDIHSIFLPLVMKSPPLTELSVFNDNTGGDVQFLVQGTGVSCTVPNNTTQYCGSFLPGTYTVEVHSQCGSGTFPKTYEAGPQTTRVFCK